MCMLTALDSCHPTASRQLLPTWLVFKRIYRYLSYHYTCFCGVELETQVGEENWAGCLVQWRCVHHNLRRFASILIIAVRACCLSIIMASGNISQGPANSAQTAGESP